ncbi:DUF2971 domain-containing protein [Thiomicrospira pelophila]|uniref:DUF2971 domain-containing protein n=1 Tax=Thiomicrospira pelophila TaxID=934 RepID=UPI0004A763DE|nr:DUF2971 domain-containing protein [Thiomicrospira pelophila]
MNTLYRYTPHTNEHRDEVILNAQLWFTKPENFNDPLDSRLDYRQEYSQAEIKYFWGGFLQSKPDHPQTIDEIMQRWGSNERFVDQQNLIFNQFRSQMGVCCFSVSPYNILMWSHYANNHKGIVYEFEPDLFLGSTTASFKGHPLKVDYAENNEYELLSYALVGKPKQEQFVTEQLTKATDWAYEQEYRFIDLNGNGNKTFKKESLKTIIVGAKTPESEIARIQNLCRQNGFGHVAFKQAKFKTGKFEIELVNI